MITGVITFAWFIPGFLLGGWKALLVRPVGQAFGPSSTAR
jgi:hypothetical protein